MAFKISEYQQKIRKSLVEIAGKPNSSRSLKGLGLDCQVWIWEIGPKSRKRYNVLIMADKAQELGLQVYKIKVDVKRSSVYRHLKSRKFSSSSNLEDIGRVVVWCPEEPPSF